MGAELNLVQLNWPVIAEKGGYNYFSFKGIRSKGNNELHVTSTHYDNQQALDLVKKVKEQ